MALPSECLWEDHVTPSGGVGPISDVCDASFHECQGELKIR